ncbi:ankyrin [Polyplosphaeria fusca]|uniref:Ankyrin n=1 Tax=Polyplosphaeria fusca TaxID=682080 RepID=A0A9P4QL39_9PLEO|nr:ankyrin [Polyplosphaeria fusca]
MHVQIVRYLLSSGADTNMGDDDRVLPVFATIGFCARDNGMNRRFAQLPPQSPAWLDLLFLLVQHGASIHESAFGRTVTMVNLNVSCCKNLYSTLRYFRLLHEAQYQDFGTVDDRDCSALSMAVSCGEESRQCLDFLAENDVDLAKIGPNGRSALHIAALAGINAEPLRHLYENYGIEEVNRMDQWGWTALHYAIDSPQNMYEGCDCDIIKYLLQKGADPYLVGEPKRFSMYHMSNVFDKPMTPYEIAEFRGPYVLERLKRDMESVGMTMKEVRDEEEQFFDAEERMM